MWGDRKVCAFYMSIKKHERIYIQLILIPSGAWSLCESLSVAQSV